MYCIKNYLTANNQTFQFTQISLMYTFRLLILQLFYFHSFLIHKICHSLCHHYCCSNGANLPNVGFKQVFYSLLTGWPAVVSVFGLQGVKAWVSVVRMPPSSLSLVVGKVLMMHEWEMLHHFGGVTSLALWSALSLLNKQFCGSTAIYWSSCKMTLISQSGWELVKMYSFFMFRFFFKFINKRDDKKYGIILLPHATKTLWFLEEHM